MKMIMRIIGNEIMTILNCLIMVGERAGMPQNIQNTPHQLDIRNATSCQTLSISHKTQAGIGAFDLSKEHGGPHYLRHTNFSHRNFANLKYADGEFERAEGG